MAWNIGLLAASAAKPADFQLIGTQVLSSSAASVTFSSIPNTFKHLQLRVVGKTNRTNSDYNWLVVRANGDSGSNYSYHDLSGNGGSVSSAGQASQAQMLFFGLAGNTSSVPGGNLYSAQIIDIVDYASGKNKTLRALTGLACPQINANPTISFGSGSWMSSAAITSLTLTDGVSTYFLAGSRFSLYGWN